MVEAPGGLHRPKIAYLGLPSLLTPSEAFCALFLTLQGPHNPLASFSSRKQGEIRHSEIAVFSNQLSYRPSLMAPLCYIATGSVFVTLCRHFFFKKVLFVLGVYGASLKTGILYTFMKITPALPQG